MSLGGVSAQVIVFADRQSAEAYQRLAGQPEIARWSGGWAVPRTSAPLAPEEDYEFLSPDGPRRRIFALAKIDKGARADRLTLADTAWLTKVELTWGRGDVMTSTVAPICCECKRLRREPGGEMTLTCQAFPDRIPDAILLSQADHREAYPGDHGLRFVPVNPDRVGELTLNPLLTGERGDEA